MKRPAAPRRRIPSTSEKIRGTTLKRTASPSYGGSGQLASISIADGRPRTISFTTDMLGQIIRRDEADGNYSGTYSGDPHEVWYRFNGKQIAFTGNNGTLDTDYAASIAARAKAPVGTYAFRHGDWNGPAVTDYDPSLERINSYGQGSAGGGYLVRAGDTLQGIALGLWGDASLWYKLAEANGLSGAAGLIEGRSLIVPHGVQANHHNASTLKPYDPAEVIGNTSPSAPQPQKKGGKCGTFGIILLVAIAVAVTVVTSGAAVAALSSTVGSIGAGIGAFVAGTAGFSTMVAAGAIGGVVGSMVSQGFGVATGIQDKFNWKGVALAGLAGGISAGLGSAFPATAPLSAAAKAVGETAKSLGTLSLIGRGVFLGASGSALTQGIGTMVGLQKKFDFAGVAAAGLAGGISAGVGRTLGAGSLTDLSARNIGANLATSTAGAIANATVRTLVNGTDFGDNLMAALPDIIGSTIGNIVALGVSGAGSRTNFLRSVGFSAKEARTLARDAARQGLDVRDLTVIAAAGGSGTPELRELAASYVNQMERWEAAISRGELDVNREAFASFKSDLAHALVAIDAYNDVSDPRMLLSGYARLSNEDVVRLGVDPAKLNVSRIGFSSSFYSTPDGTYIYAFRGSDQWSDYRSNLSQDFGWRSAQYDHVATHIQDIVNAIGPIVSFTGHSLGGGLATLASLMTGMPATVLVPAPMHNATLDRYHVRDAAEGANNVRALVIVTEALYARAAASRSHSIVGDDHRLFPAYAAKEGDQFVTSAALNSNPFALHNSDRVLASLFYTHYVETFRAYGTLSLLRRQFGY